MRYAIIGDIHANLEALDAVLFAIAQKGLYRFFCCGDIVGYGADPQFCIQRMQDLNAVCVAGNHDWVAGCRKAAEAFNPLARVAIEWTKMQLHEDQKAFLRDLPLTYEDTDMTVVHGTPYEPENFHYLDSLLDAHRTFRCMKTPVCFVAHNHIPAIITMKGDDSVSYSLGYSAQRQEGYRYIINVGSVGQPRDGRSEAAYCLYDPEQGHIEICRVPYDIRKAQNKILKAGLPDQLAARLSVGF